MNGKTLKKVIQSLIISAITVNQLNIASYASENKCINEHESDACVNKVKEYSDTYVNQAKEYAEIFLEEWNDLKSAFREEKLEAKKNLSELNFKGDSILDDIMLFRDSDVSRKGLFYWKLILFDESFEELDKSVEKFKDINWFMSRPELLNDIKKQITDMVEKNELVLSDICTVDDLSKCPMEFYAWLKIGLMFNDLSVQCRSVNIGIYREDPDCPLQRNLRLDN